MDRLQAMRVFTRVAELGSFTRAASELGLSRARVSEAVSELERALGARLLHRTTRRVSLSDDGRAYHERARQILADMDDAEAQLAGSRAKVRGLLRVAMPMALARSMVVPALPRFLARHPELRLEVRLENRALHLLEDGVDCALSYGLPADAGLVAQSILSTHLATCASPTYLARRGVPREPTELALHDCVSFLALDSARPTPWSFSSGGVSSGVSSSWQPRGQLAFNSMEACVEAAVAGLGITQVLSSLAQPALATRRLEAVLARHAAPGPSIYLVYPQHRQASPRLRALLGFLRDVFARIAKAS
jgi:LysR family transcriptional regulator, regulator for bpeEF and oprC